MQTHRRIASVLVLCCAAIAAAPASGDTELPLAEHVPASAVVYAGWRGADVMQPSYQQSTLKAVIEDAGLKDRWLPMYRELLARAEEEVKHEPVPAMRDDAQRMLQLAEALPDIAWRRPWAVFLTNIDFTGAEPLGRVGFLVDAGPMRQQVVSLVDAMLEAQRKGSPDVPAEKIDRDGVVGLIIGHALPEAKLGFDLEAMAGRTMAEPTLLVFADAAAGFDMLERGIRKQEGEGQSRRVQAVLDVLGLSDLRSLVYAAGFEGRRWRQNTHVRIPTPRRGIFDLLEGEPLGESDWQLLPATASWATLFRFDLDAVLGLIREAIAATDEEEALQAFNAGLAEASEELGLDLERDIIAPFGDTWAIYSEPTFATGFGPGVCFLNDADDGDRLKRTLGIARERINAMLRDEGPGFQIAAMDMGGIEISSLSLPFVGLSWAVADDRFYFALSPTAVLTAHEAASKPDQSLANSEKFQRVRDRLQRLGAGRNVISLSFTDLEQTAPRIYPTYAMLLNLVSAPLLQETGINAMTLLPPLGAIRPHLEPAGGVTWFDDAGMHTLSIQPFPGSDLLSPEATWSYTSSVAPLGVGIMLPALGAARHSARTAVSSSNARQIGVALMTYFVDHNETMPPSLAELIVGGYLPASVLRSPGISRALPTDLKTMAPEKRAAAVRRSSSYLMVDRTPLHEVQQPANRIVVFERPEDAPCSEEIAVLFYDGHVERMPVERVARRIKDQTGATLEQWLKAAKAGALPQAIETDEDVGGDEAAEAEAVPAEEASDTTAPPAPR